MCNLCATGPGIRTPMEGILLCASAANGAVNIAASSQANIATPSPISRMGTSWGMAGGSVSEGADRRRRPRLLDEVMPKAGSCASADPSLPPILGDGPARLLHLQVSGASGRARTDWSRLSRPPLVAAFDHLLP